MLSELSCTVDGLVICLGSATGGTIRVVGEQLTGDERRSRAVRRRIGTCSRSSTRSPNMTVRGNLIEAPTRVLGLSRSDADARAVELLELVGLGEKIDEHPSRLSGGQQQRVAIARALASRGARAAARHRVVDVRGEDRGGPLRPLSCSLRPPQTCTQEFLEAVLGR